MKFMVASTVSIEEWLAAATLHSEEKPPPEIKYSNLQHKNVF